MFFFGVEAYAKKKLSPISNHLDRSSFVDRGLIVWLRQVFFPCETKARNVSEQDRPIAQIANQNTRFALSCPLADPAISEKNDYILNPY